MSERDSLPPLRHYAGFLASGGIAFLVDAGITTLLIHFAGFDPFTARIAGVLVAMVAAWLMHRRFTFNVSAPPSVAEFSRFATVAWSANLLNYIVYATILIVFAAVWPLVALVISTAVAMSFSYLGYRRGVFREFRPDS
ncbi:MAG: GtrA family protein [Alphaproteobacteria bacterium]